METALPMPIESTEHVTVAGSKAAAPNRNRVARAQQRSRITNGTALLPGTDNRSAWCRRAKDVIAAHTADIGGDDCVSEAERSIIRRIAVLTTELERLEAKFAGAGEASERDLDLYIRGSGSLRRLLEVIGLQRRPRDVTPAPTLAELLEREAVL
jgi:hypothetical protein